ncbi:MAG: FecR domain-containing protein [Deltaproteobacteria bacterium]|nr:FecR domain-containing protein [Deltaproteobacteria bacterium]
MSHLHPNPGRCEELREALAEVVALEDLADRHLAHAETCEACEALLERQRALALLVTRARRAHDRAPDLSLQTWARIRQGVDLAQARRRRFALIGLGLAAATAVAVIALVRPGDHQVEPIAARGLTASRTELIAVATPTFEPRRDTREGGRELVVAAGDRLDGGARGRTLEAFGRHTIIVEPGAALRVRQWAPAGMDLELEAGSATFEVERASTAETFVVHAGPVEVRVKGTIFSVDRGARGDTRVTVDRGRVVVSHDGEDIDVEAGERVVIPAEATTAAAAEDAPSVSDSGGQAGTAGTAGAAAVEAPREGPSTPRPQPARKRPAPEKVVEIDVGMQRAPGVGAAAPEVTAADAARLVEPILMTVRAGRCAQALNAIGEIRRATHEDGPRSLLWLRAWCKRKLGDVEGSASLFRRYGSAGPWPVPVGSELPPLP